MNLEKVIDWVRVFKSKYVYDTSTPWWEPEVIKLTELCNNKKTLPLRITVLCYTNSGKHATYGRIVTSVREIEMSDRELPLISLRGKPAGILKVSHFKLDMKPSLLSYLRSGWHIDTTVAIDFTLSNLETTNLKSLHRLDPMRPRDMNIYEKAIFEVCKVLQPYSKRTKECPGAFAAYGFGGVPLYTDKNGQIKEDLRKDLDEHLDRKKWTALHEAEEKIQSEVKRKRKPNFISNSDDEGDSKAADMSQGKIIDINKRRP
jgi:hypothetical protein